MVRLSDSEKKRVNAGAASLMGIATGVLTVTGVMNFIFDLINRYWGGKSRLVTVEAPSCNGSFSSCWGTHPEIWHAPEEEVNRITLLEDSAGLEL